MLDLPGLKLLAVAGMLYRLRKDGLPAPGMQRRIVMEEGSRLVHALGVVHGSPAEINEVLVPRTIAEQRRRGPGWPWVPAWIWAHRASPS